MYLFTFTCKNEKNIISKDFFFHYMTVMKFCKFLLQALNFKRKFSQLKYLDRIWIFLGNFSSIPIQMHYPLKII